MTKKFKKMLAIAYSYWVVIICLLGGHPIMVILMGRVRTQAYKKLLGA